MKPIICIIPAFENDFYKLNMSYVNCLEEEGGIAVIVPYINDSSTIINSCDGIIFSGGGDFCSGIINEPLDRRASGICRKRDFFEMDIIRKAFNNNIPVLGICRGMQIMCIAMGGKIIQHIENHVQDLQRNSVYHSVQINQESMLYDIIGNTALGVNSFHHQAVLYPGRNMIVSSVSQDGIIESCEAPYKQFFMGVQWHPEAFDKNSEHRKIFKAFINESIDFHKRFKV